MKNTRLISLALRSVLVASALTLAMSLMPSDPAGGYAWRQALFYGPTLIVLLVTLLFTERLPELRALRGISWLLVFALFTVGVVATGPIEAPDENMLGFLFLAVVVATSRNRIGGVLTGAMAALGYAFLVWRHDLGEPLALENLPRQIVLFSAGVFTGFLSQELEREQLGRAEEMEELEELRLELANLGQHLKNVLSCVSSGVLVVDGDGRVSTYNRAAERILGLPAHKVLGRQLEGVEGLGKRLSDLLAPAPRVGDSSLRPDFTFQHPDGRQALVGYEVTDLEDLAARRLGRIMVFQDVSLIRDYEERLLDQEKLAALGRMISGIAHEFGNLLGGARGHVDIALQGEAEDAREALPIVRETLDRALTTIDHLLRFARGTPLSRVPGVDLREVLEKALNLLRVQLQQGEVSVETEFAEIKPVSADVGQLQQVFVNILINAIHSMQGQETRKLHLALAQEGEQVRITFDDTGPGIPKELRQRIFEPFFTTKGSLGGSSVPGTGLGLAMARGVIKAHEGTLETSATPVAPGARFTIRLPST